MYYLKLSLCKYFAKDILLTADEKLKIVDTHIEKLREEISKIDQLSKKHKDIKCQETLILVRKLQTKTPLIK